MDGRGEGATAGWWREDRAVVNKAMFAMKCRLYIYYRAPRTTPTPCAVTSRACTSTMTLSELFRSFTKCCCLLPVLRDITWGLLE